MKSSLQLAQEARDYKFNPVIPLRIYLRTCIGILDKAQLSVQAGDSAMAFTYYYRYVDLCTNRLSRHPEFLAAGKQAAANADPELALYRQEYLQLIKLEVPAVMRLIEELKNKIDAEWERHQVSLARNIARTRSGSNHRDQHESVKCGTVLPATFSEHNFQQSLSFFQSATGHRSTATAQNGAAATSRVNTSSTSGTSASGSSAREVGQATAPANSETAGLHLYPELPQLSFPTF